MAVLYGVGVEPSLLPESQRSIGQPPYRSELDARAAIEAGKGRAAATGKMLMVTFGANWCPDCVTLHQNLYAAETRAYAEKHFEIVEIDVGDAKKSAAVQRDLGISVYTHTAGGILFADGRAHRRHVRGRAQAVAPLLVPRDP